MTVECPRPGCHRSRWHATGRFTMNRFGLWRAELVCDECRGVFASALPEAIAAGEAISGPVPTTRPPAVPVRQPGLFTAPQPPQAQPTLTRVAALVHDFRQKQTGERDE